MMVIDDEFKTNYSDPQPAMPGLSDEELSEATGMTFVREQEAKARLNSQSTPEPEVPTTNSSQPTLKTSPQ